MPVHKLKPVPGDTVHPRAILFVPGAKLVEGRFTLLERISGGNCIWKARVSLTDEDVCLRIVPQRDAYACEAMMSKLVKQSKSVGSTHRRFLTTIEVFHCKRSNAVVLVSELVEHAIHAVSALRRLASVAAIQEFALEAIEILVQLHDAGGWHGSLDEDKWLREPNSSETYLVGGAHYDLGADGELGRTDDVFRLLEIIRKLSGRHGDKFNWLTAHLPNEWVRSFAAWQMGERSPQSALQLRDALASCQPTSMPEQSLVSMPQSPFVDVRSAGIWLLESPVTQKMWKNVTGFSLADHLNVMSTTISHKFASFLINDHTPVFGVTWDEASRFSEIATGWFKSQYLLPTKWKLRLPAHGEWLAAFGPAIQDDKVAHLLCWNQVCNHRAAGPAPCYREDGSPIRPRTAAGLVDMIGNVAEWCNGDSQFAGGVHPVAGGGWKRGDWERCLNPGNPSRSREPVAASIREAHIGFRLVACRE